VAEFGAETARPEDVAAAESVLVAVCSARRPGGEVAGQPGSGPSRPGAESRPWQDGLV